LKADGYEVVFVSPKDEYAERLKEDGFRWVELKISRRNTLLLKEVMTLASFIRIYRREKPVAVHHFTVKCVLYGTMAAYLNRVPAIINSITGLGHLFIDQNPRTKFLRSCVQFAYRRILKLKKNFVIFQNPDDYGLFVSNNLIDPARAAIIRGSGVDTTRFRPQVGETQPLILFASRLTHEKGISELLEGFGLLRKRGCKASLILAGSPDPGNPSSVSAEDLANWTRQNSDVQFIGHVEDIEPLIARSRVVVLPSYREGTPRILLEAAAMAKPLVATDVPGCREIVENGKNGFLVPAQNAEAIADALETLLDSKDLCETMGRAGRQKVLDEFDTTRVNFATLKIYNKMVGNR
jgi:glycosyltransferase involved in cell wall biosynthesis